MSPRQKHTHCASTRGKVVGGVTEATVPSLLLPHRRRLSVERIDHHGRQHGVATLHVDLNGAIDRDRLFTCPTLAPLAHDPVFATLTAPQQRRYNQLVGLMQNEIICFFEQEFAARVLPALLRDRRALPAELAQPLAQFAQDEREHTRMFRRLNQLAEPAWYGRSDYHILRLPRAFVAAVRVMTDRPAMFPMVFWVMLLMEERSLMIGRRYAAAEVAAEASGRSRLEPHFVAAYRAHQEDEVRHVQLDWHLLERFYQSRPPRVRALNGRLLEAFVIGLFLKPRRANARLVELLIDDFPDLRPRRRELLAAVRNLIHNPGYRAMMYSDDSTPIAKALLERTPELARLRRRMFAAPDGAAT